MASSSSSGEISGYQRERTTVSPKEYDVFINYRGSHVKETLAKQLYNLLQGRECRVFLDCGEIEGGDSTIPSAVRDSICSSFVQIAIFSKGACSRAEPSSFLNELVLMLEQSDAVFIPVFYDVQPLELRTVANERSSFYRSLRIGMHKLNRRERALISASYFSGFEVSQHKDDLCEKILSRVLQVLQTKEKWIPIPVAEYPVGLAELVQDFKRCCSETGEEEKVKIVGIFGLGGSGKSTLAKELFNMKRLGYNASCFLSNVSESHAKGALHCLQSQIFKDLFDGDRMFRNIDEGIRELKDCLGRAKHLDFLIVLDDIDHPEQLEALLFEGMLSPGSLVILTTRVQSLLRGSDMIRYRMMCLDKRHDKELFCSHAFRGQDPPIAYEKLVGDFVKFCGGFPLSLKVLGANVYGLDVHYWELELEKVRKTLPKDIMERLIIGFDDLNSQEKQIFIDIACFLDMNLTWYMKNRAAFIWNASGWSVEDSVKRLEDKCLVEVSGHFQSFEMQNHLRDLGRQMADDFGTPRLWQPDILTSMEAKGFKQILAETKSRCFHSFKDSSLETKFTYFIDSLNDSAEAAELLLLEIDNYLGNLKSIPSWIPLRKLRCFTVRNMKEIWSTFQQQLQTNTRDGLELRVLMIFNSPLLQNLPDLIGMCSHLEVLYISSSLENTDVTSFVQSLKQLSKLRSLDMWFGGTLFFSGNLDLSKGGDSTNFETSTSSCMSSLETAVFRRLDNISKLVVSGEICPRLESLEVMHMPNLNEMDLKQLRRLNKLQVCGCDKLETLTGLKEVERLNTLIVQRCLRLEIISGLSCVTELRELHAESCNGLKSLPNLSDLPHLERITIVECRELQSVEGVEELQELKSLVIGAPDNGDASATVFSCIHGLRRLPAEFAIFTGKAADGISSRMDVDLFSEVIGAEAVSEVVIEREEKGLSMRSSSSEITVYALLVTSKTGFQVSAYQTSLVSFRQLQAGIFVVTVLLTTGKTKVGITHSATIFRGFKVTFNEGEEGKALSALRIIVDRLYVQSMELNVAVCDVSSGGGSPMECD